MAASIEASMFTRKFITKGLIAKSYSRKTLLNYYGDDVIITSRLDSNKLDMAITTSAITHRL